MSIRRRLYCRRSFHPNRRAAAFQKACGRVNCKRARKQHADRRWRERNPGYDESRRPKRLQWQAHHPTYSSQYRSTHPAYVERNRRQTRERMKRARQMFANQDAIRCDPVGYLQGLRDLALFANQDAMARSIDGVVLFLLQGVLFANPNAIASGTQAGG